MARSCSRKRAAASPAARCSRRARFDLETAQAIGTGGLSFSLGAQTLSLDNDVFVGGAFQNEMFSFGSSDAIDLPEINPSGAHLSYHPGTGVLNLGVGGGVTYTFTFFRPTGIDFVLESDGAGGTRIVLGAGVTITGTSGDDLIDATHTVPGEALPTTSADLIDGAAGADRISGLDGNDWLIGGKGRDFLKGGKGDDRLEGGLGRNKLKGGDGADTFVLAPVFGDGAVLKGGKANGHAHVLDFDTDSDIIELDAGSFLAIGPTLEEGEFRIGLKAKDDDDHILYHAKSGRLLYDEDGKGGEDAVEFARLDRKLDMDAGNFLASVGI